jgi:PPM family protein phosphatase
MKVRPGVEVASLTDVGCKRDNNEDYYAYWEPKDDAVFERIGRLAIVADGMGGAEGGQFASRIAVEAVRAVYASVSEEDPRQRLLTAFRKANAEVQQEAQQKPGLRGMGTTLSACAIVGQNLYFAHVGDSRVFLIRAGEAQQLTRDHSLVARLIESRTIRPEDAENHPQKHVLTAAVGVCDDLQPDFSPEPVPLQHSDTLVICTDGLWGQMSSAEIAEIVSARGVHDACKALVQLARERGGPDNITLQVLRVS